MRRAYIIAIGLLIAALFAGCGGTSASSDPITAVSSTVGKGADKTWVIAPSRGDPLSVVVFLHGLGDQKETTPAHHRPWLDHLARRGSYVLYPRYELHPGARLGMKHAVIGTLAALEKVAVVGADGTITVPRKALRDAIYATKDFKGITGNLSCSPSGDCGAPVIAVYQVVNADPASWNPADPTNPNPKKVYP